MDIVKIGSWEDTRIAPYRRLKDRELAREGNRFIAEGEFVVRRLLASAIKTESVLLAERRAAEIAPLVPPGVAIYVAPDQIIHQIIGFRFHSGVIACGMRPAPPSLAEIAGGNVSRPLLLVVCPDLNNAENLGGLIRLSAAFGAHAMLLGPESVDPFWRQSVRVSMGTVFTLPIVRSDNLVDDLLQLRDDFGVELLATVLDDDAQPLSAFKPASRTAILFGNEAQGLPTNLVNLCTRKVTIPMQRGVDSLNVAVSAGIFLYVLTGQKDRIS